MTRATSLHAAHVESGARMVDFAGYEMPIQYTGIIDEHNAVRQAAGLFDLGHMGRILITGPDREAFLDGLVTNTVLNLEPGAARYALMPREDGGVLDDVIYYVFPRSLLLVVNASNRAKILQWLDDKSADAAITITDLSDDWAMIALQGPKAKATLTPLTDLDLSRVKNYRAAGGTVMGIPCLIARTGYTGEDGFELYFDAHRAPFLWRELLDVGQEHGVKACGLGARDTLRLEAGMPLYGHELDEKTNPLEAGLGFALQLDKGPFCGRAAIQRCADEGPKKQLRGFFLDGRGVPRQGMELFVAGADTPCGIVSSGTHSPTLQRPLCMAFVQADTPSDAPLELALRKTKRLPLIPTKLPFYKRKKAKKKARKPSAE